MHISPACAKRVLAVRFAITVKVKAKYSIGSSGNLLSVDVVGKLTANDYIYAIKVKLQTSANAGAFLFTATALRIGPDPEYLFRHPHEPIGKQDTDAER